MRRILRILLVVGLLAGSLALCSPSSQAEPHRRGWGRGYGWGRGPYGPGWGYHQVYRPYGYGRGGYGMGYRGYGWGYGGYPAYGVTSYPAYGYGMYGAGYPGYGYGGWGYPGVYGTSVSIGSPIGGFSVGAYPY